MRLMVLDVLCFIKDNTFEFGSVEDALVCFKILIPPFFMINVVIDLDGAVRLWVGFSNL